MKTTRRFELLRFYIPLAIQALSQTLTWPLVASVITQGAHGPQEYAAYVQGQIVVLFFGAIGYGLISTGMIFVACKKSFRNFNHVSLGLAGVAVACQVLCMISPIDRWVFVDFLGLQGPMVNIAKWSFLGSIPMQFIFFVCNMPSVILLNNKKTSFLNYATIGRMVLTVILSSICSRHNWVGWFWGCVCCTLPIALETATMYGFAWPFIKRLPEDPPKEVASPWKLIRFNMPLSIGGMMLSSSGVLLAMLLARTKDSTTVLSIHYLLMGVINPLGFTALRTQSVAIAYPPDEYGAHVARRFSISVGLFFSGIALLLQLPFVRDGYFVRYQNMAPEEAKLAAQTLLLIFLLPLMQSLRGNAEGLAAVKRYPSAAMVGQITYGVSLVLLILLLLKTEWVPAYQIGALSIFGAIILAWLGVLIALHVFLRLHKPQKLP